MKPGFSLPSNGQGGKNHRHSGLFRLPFQPGTPPVVNFAEQVEQLETQEMPALFASDRPDLLVNTETLEMPVITTPPRSSVRIKRGTAAVLLSLLCLVIIHALTFGPAQFLGERGWSFVLGGSKNNNPNLLTTPQTTATAQATPDAQQMITQLISHMSLDQKLGQMMMAQFTGEEYSGDLDALITQYYAGSIMLIAGNRNIQSAAQIKSVTDKMQEANKNNGMFPLLVAIDQEGGTVDRLADLRGASPSAAEIGATNDPEQAKTMGKKDAQDLAQYGIQLNFAPVVDVGDPAYPGAIMSSQGRVYGDNADTVTSMASAYLQGLQESGKVAGTLKHFPGLGSVLGDPHQVTVYQRRTKDMLEQKDWAPYRALIQQGLVNSIMVTHVYVTQIDPDNPASLSSKVVQGILRDEMGFQGVIMTDSLSMGGIAGTYSLGQAAAQAIIAGSDIVMGGDISTIGGMIDGVKQAMDRGEISQQRIDDSVRRILLLKYKLGLLAQ